MSENGDSIIKVVNLFIDNINESAKNTSKAFDNLCIKVDSVITKLNTPPRNEELSSQVDDLKSRFKALNETLSTVADILKKIAFVSKTMVIGIPLTVLLVGGILGYTKYLEVKKIELIEQRITLEEKNIKTLDTEIGYHLLQTAKDKEKAEKNKKLMEKEGVLPSQSHSHP